MKKWIGLGIVITSLLISCKKAEEAESAELAGLPQFREFFAFSSADTSSFFTGTIEVKEGDWVWVYYAIENVARIELYDGGQCFMSSAVDGYIRSGFGWECRAASTFQIVARNRWGSSSNQISVRMVPR